MLTFPKKKPGYYKKVHHILAKEMPMILLNFQTQKRAERGIATLKITTFI